MKLKLHVFRARWPQFLLLLVLATGLAMAGCRKPRKRAHTKEQQRRIDQALLSEAPKPQFPVGANLDGTIKLLGVDLDRKTVGPGETLKLTWYWESLQATDQGWKVFVHFEAPGKRSTHDHHPVDDLYPISSWRPGQIITYTQEIAVGADFPNSGVANLMVGVFDEVAYRERQASVRMKPVNGAELGAKLTDDGRIKIASVRLGKGKPGAKAKAPSLDKGPRAYTAHKLSEPVVLDGQLNDAGWRGVPWTKAFVDPFGKHLSSKKRTRAKLAWDDTNLYVAFDCPDNDIFNDQKGRDATLWKQDVVEIYLDPAGDGQDYLELQISPTGEIFDAHFSSRRKPDWPAAAERLTLAGMAVKVHAIGTINDRSGPPDRRWTAEIAIPFAELPGVDGPPSGQEWGMNLYRIDVGSRGFMAAWAPAGGDFHNVDDFGKITFSTSPPSARRSIRKPGANAVPMKANPAAPAPAPTPAPAP